MNREPSTMDSFSTSQPCSTPKRAVGQAEPSAAENWCDACSRRLPDGATTRQARLARAEQNPLPSSLEKIEAPDAAAELLPCPFCGGTRIGGPYKASRHEFYVACISEIGSSCGSAGGVTPGAAIAAWNCRSTPADSARAGEVEPWCSWCGRPVLPGEPTGVSDGERMHLHCAAEDMDNATFDRDMGFD